MLVIVYFIWSIDIIRKYFKRKDVFEWISWCLFETSSQVNILHNNQNHYLDEDIEKIDFDDKLKKEYTVSILKEYRKELVRNYFKDNIKIVKSKYDLDGEDYFLSTFCEYLGNHQCDENLGNYKMHDDLKTYKYAQFNSSSSSSTYYLSDFGGFYFKLFYIVYASCYNSKVLNPKGQYYTGYRNIKQNIESNTIEIVRYMP